MYLRIEFRKIKFRKSESWKIILRMTFQKTKFRKLKCQKIILISKYEEIVKKKKACGDPHLQDFSTCSKWQPIYSLCCQHTKECHKTTSHITIMPFKPTFHASLLSYPPCTSREHHKPIFFFMKNKHHNAATFLPIRHSHYHVHGVSIGGMGVYGSERNRFGWMR